MSHNRHKMGRLLCSTIWECQDTKKSKVPPFLSTLELEDMKSKALHQYTVIMGDKTRFSCNQPIHTSLKCNPRHKRRVLDAHTDFVFNEAKPHKLHFRTWFLDGTTGNIPNFFVNFWPKGSSLLFSRLCKKTRHQGVLKLRLDQHLPECEMEQS